MKPDCTALSCGVTSQRQYDSKIGSQRKYCPPSARPAHTTRSTHRTLSLRLWNWPPNSNVRSRPWHPVWNSSNSSRTSVKGLVSGTPEPCSGTSRSEEHTSELQSRGHLVCRLLLEKKKEQ